MTETIKLGRHSAGFLPLLGGFDYPALHDFAAEIAFVQGLTENGFMHHLEFGEGEFLGQKLKSDAGVIQLISNALVSIFDNLKVIKGQSGQLVDWKPGSISRV